MRATQAFAKASNKTKSILLYIFQQGKDKIRSSNTTRATKTESERTAETRCRVEVNARRSRKQGMKRGCETKTSRRV